MVESIGRASHEIHSSRGTCPKPIRILVLAIACPKCAKMLEGAIVVEDLEDELRVMDIAEMVEERAA